MHFTVGRTALVPTWRCCLACPTPIQRASACQGDNRLLHCWEHKAALHWSESLLLHCSPCHWCMYCTVHETWLHALLDVAGVTCCFPALCQIASGQVYQLQAPCMQHMNFCCWLLIVPPDPPLGAADVFTLPSLSWAMPSGFARPQSVLALPDMHICMVC